MAVVVLARVWLHTATDLSDRIEIEDVTAFPLDVSIAGREVVMASGRVRSISNPGTLRRLAVTCTAVSEAQRDDLLRRQGVMQLWRDPHGRRHWGVFRDVNVTPLPGFGQSNVALTFTEITHSEAV